MRTFLAIWSLIAIGLGIAVAGVVTFFQRRYTRARSRPEDLERRRLVLRALAHDADQRRRHL